MRNVFGGFTYLIIVNVFLISVSSCYFSIHIKDIQQSIKFNILLSGIIKILKFISTLK